MTHTKGIILAGGSGTRLYPVTSSVSKQLLPIYDKPMIYYPLATLMLSGIREILVITAKGHSDAFMNLLGNGEQWGIRLTFLEQEEPRGIAEAFSIGRKFIGGSQVCLILGDNLFYGKLDFIRKAITTNEGATIFAYQVKDPERYGVVEFGADGSVATIEEKPEKPKSHFAIPGVYVFTPDVCEFVNQLQPSERGELEISDLQKIYLQHERLCVVQIGRGIAWLDTGTPDALVDAATFIQAIEKRQGTKIACLEEISLELGICSPEQISIHVDSLPQSDYKRYCETILREF